MNIKKIILYPLTLMLVIILIILGLFGAYRYEEYILSKRSLSLCAIKHLSIIINQDFIIKGTYPLPINLKTDIYNQNDKILCGNDIKKDSLGVMDAFGDRIIYKRISDNEAVVYSINAVKRAGDDISDGLYAVKLKSGVISFSQVKLTE